MADLSEADLNLLSPGKHPLYRFVMTGGPCGGKSTALARVSSFLRERGFQVITCPEAYSLLSNNGMTTDFFGTPGMAKCIQKTVMDVQISLEDSVSRVLQARGRPAVVLCDRGTMDGAVYLSSEEFAAIARERQSDIVELRDQRYDAIFHLVTAADGAAHAYTLDNNKVRTESVEEAVEVDGRTQAAWTGHPHLYVIDNATDFEGKMSRLVDTVSKIVGLPSNLSRRAAKFLLSSPPDLKQFPEDLNIQVFEVEKAYLASSSESQEYSFIRRRSSVDRTGRVVGSVYQLTTVKRVDEKLVEQKRIITQREYVASYQTRCSERHIVKQRRVSFIYLQQSFSVHLYQAPVDNLCILHAQVEASKEKVILPPFLSVDRKIQDTEEDAKQFGAYQLSLI